MAAKELLQKSAVELAREADELRGSIRELRFKIATRQHGKVRDIRAKKRQLARIMTVLANKKPETSTNT